MNRYVLMGKSFTAITLMTLTLLSCQHRGGQGFKVNGTLTAIPVHEVYLSSISFDNKPTLIMDSATVVHGKFELKGPGGEQQLFRVMLGDPNNAPWMGVVSDNSVINLSMDGSLGGNYTVTGSPASQRFHVIFDSLHVLLDVIQQSKESLSKGGDTAAMAQLLGGEKTREFYAYLAQVAKNETSPVIAAFALNFYGIGADEQSAAQYGVNTSNFDVATLDTLSADLLRRFPGNGSVTATVSGIGHILDVPRVGKIAPDLSLPDTSGKIFSLSSLRGKYVLVDFWASWCGPCREENPNVVKAYDEFKDKNFTIVGVSLDQKKDDWLKAIYADHLTWTHISDLAFWQSKAVETFQFTAIPYNVLLDPQGKIVATGLRGEDLEDKLHALLK